VASDGGAATLAVDGASSGRGAWLCRAAMGNELIVDTDCLERALTQRQFDRAWRTKLDHHDVEAIHDALRHDEQHTS
jgi:predicted RNA-binding protein YlxR (DUF448 family)